MLINRTFERKGLEARVSHKSYKELGIDHKPTIPLGPKFSEMERRGIKTAFGNANRDIGVRNKEIQRQIEVEIDRTSDRSR